MSTKRSNRTARHRAKLARKHLRQRLRAGSQASKKRNGRLRFKKLR